MSVVIKDNNKVHAKNSILDNNKPGKKIGGITHLGEMSWSMNYWMRDLRFMSCLSKRPLVNNIFEFQRNTTWARLADNAKNGCEGDQCQYANIKPGLAAILVSTSLGWHWKKNCDQVVPGDLAKTWRRSSYPLLTPYMIPYRLKTLSSENLLHHPLKGTTDL